MSLTQAFVVIFSQQNSRFCLKTKFFEESTLKGPPDVVGQNECTSLNHQNKCYPLRIKSMYFQVHIRTKSNLFNFWNNFKDFDSDGDEKIYFHELFASLINHLSFDRQTGLEGARLFNFHVQEAEILCSFSSCDFG